jgi:hypothetical protein
MRLALRLAGVLVVLVVTALIALAVALPRLVRSDAARGRIEEAAREATGREIRYGELDFGLLPPRLVVREPEVRGASADSPPVFKAAGVELEIALVPLLAWTVVVDSLVVEGATVRLVRTPRGIGLPRETVSAEAPEDGDAAPPPREGEGSELAGEAAPSEAPESDAERDDEGGGFALAVREVALRDCRVLLEDRAVSPPITWEIREVVATASGKSLMDPIDFELRGVLTSGGSFQASGEAKIDGPFRIDLQLEDVALDPAAPYLAEGQRVRGAVSGTVSATGKDREAESLALDVLLRDGELAAEGLAIRGEMKIRADLAGGLGDGNGTFQVDATDAELEYGVGFQKGRGTAATATGRIETGPDGHIRLRDTQVKIQNFEAEVQLETGARTRATVDAEPLELAGWETMIPALADYRPAGELTSRDLEVATEPLEVRGTVDLPNLRFRRPDGAEVVLRGGFRGTGEEIRSEKLVAVVAGQEIRLSILVADLAGQPRLTTEVAADDVESSALLALVTDKSDTLQGPLELRGGLASPLGGDRPLAETLQGTVRFRIEPGRLKGVSLLEKTFQGVGAAGDAALVAGRLKGGRTLQRFYDDEFQFLGGTLRIARGLARTDDLRLEYRNYTVDLRGTVGLLDQRLDLRGKLTIDDEIDSAIANQGAADPLPQPGRSRVIPLARVTGTLESPRVEITDEAVIRFAALYATERRREKWERKIDERLGEGSGREVLDALDEILSGERREPQP